MPQRHISSSSIYPGEQPLPENQCEKHTNGLQSTFTRWMGPVMPHSQSLVALPRRMAELICGACGTQTEPIDGMVVALFKLLSLEPFDETNSITCLKMTLTDLFKGYLLLPEAQTELYDPDQPYSLEKVPVATASSPCTHGTFSLVDLPQNVTAPIDRTSFSSQDTVASFTHNEPLYAEPVLNHGDFAYLQSQQPSAILSDAFMKEEPDALVSSPLQNFIPVGGFHPVAFDQDGLYASMSPWDPQLNLGTEPTYFVAPLVPPYCSTEQTGQQPWPPSVSQPTQSNFDILLPNQRGGKRGPFKDPSLREQTAQTRKIGSCIRCRMQRIRVSFFYCYIIYYPWP